MRVTGTLPSAAAPARDPGEGMLQPALLLAASRAVGFASGLLIPIVLARVFDPTTFGVYKQIFLVCATLHAVAQVGLAECLYYFLPRDPAAAGRYAANALLALLAAGGVAAGLLLLGGRPALGRLVDAGAAAHAAFVAWFLLLTLGGTVLEIVMVARSRWRAAAAAYVASDVLRALLLIAPALAHPTLGALLAGAAAYAALRLAATVAWLVVEFGPGLRADRRLMAAQLGYALPFGAAVLVETLQGHLHQYAVAWRFDAATFAVYSIGGLQLPLVDFVAVAIGNVMMVRMGEQLRDGRSGGPLAAWRETTARLALLFFPLLALVLVTGGDLIVLLFTEQYAASVPIFLLGSAAIALAILPVDAVLRTHAETRLLLVLNGVRLLAVVALIGPLMGAFGLIGAVLVTLIAATLARALALARVRRLLGASPRTLLPWGALALTLLAATAAGLAGRAVRGAAAGWPILPRLAASGVVTVAAYLAVAARAGLLPELRPLLARARRRRSSLDPLTP